MAEPTLDAAGSRGERGHDAAAALASAPDSPFLDVLLARAGTAVHRASRDIGTALERVTAGVATLRRGGCVLLTSNVAGRERGYLVVPAGPITPTTLGFITGLSSGLLCVAMPAHRCAELGLTPMVADESNPDGTVFAVSVDARSATDGGSLLGRCRTVTMLGTANTAAADLRRPGHVFPLITRAGGVLDAGGFAEAAVELVRLAEFEPAAVVCEVMLTEERAAPRSAELASLSRRHHLTVVSLDEVVLHSRVHQGAVQVGASTSLPTSYGQFTVDLLVSPLTATEVLVLRTGDLAEDASDAPPLVSVHSECVIGDAFGSSRCDCSARLREALAAVAESGRGAVFYVRDSPYTGVLDVLRQYAGPDGSAHPTPESTAAAHDAAADALHALNIRSVRLLSAAEEGAEAIERLGIRVSSIGQQGAQSTR